MKTEFTTPIIRQLIFDGDEASYTGIGEEIFSEENEYLVRFDLHISVEVVRTPGNYELPPEYNFKNELVSISNIHLFKGEEEIELSGEDFDDMEKQLMESIVWEI